MLARLRPASQPPSQQQHCAPMQLAAAGTGIWLGGCDQVMPARGRYVPTAAGHPQSESNVSNAGNARSMARRGTNQQRAASGQWCMQRRHYRMARWPQGHHALALCSTILHAAALLTRDCEGAKLAAAGQRFAKALVVGHTQDCCLRAVLLRIQQHGVCSGGSVAEVAAGV